MSAKNIWTLGGLRVETHLEEGHVDVALAGQLPDGPVKVVHLRDWPQASFWKWMGGASTYKNRVQKNLKFWRYVHVIKLLLKFFLCVVWRLKKKYIKDPHNPNSAPPPNAPKAPVPAAENFQVRSGCTTKRSLNWTRVSRHRAQLGPDANVWEGFLYRGVNFQRKKSRKDKFRYFRYEITKRRRENFRLLRRRSFVPV